MKFIVLLGLISLTACATVKEVSSQVSSVSKLDASAANLSYRFERLPLQEAGAASIPGTQDAAFQERLEGWASQALGLVGMAQLASTATSAATTPYSVQVTAQVKRIGSVDPLYTWPYPSLNMMVHGGTVRPGWGLGVGWGYRFGLPYHPYGYDDGQRSSEVSVLLRDTRNGAVVFESKALHRGYALPGDTLFPALFRAALSGFPKPPEGVRKVVIELPEKS